PNQGTGTAVRRDGELPMDFLDVRVNGVRGDPKLPGDVGVGKAVGDEDGDPRLSRGQAELEVQEVRDAGPTLSRSSCHDLTLDGCSETTRSMLRSRRSGESVTASDREGLRERRPGASSRRLVPSGAKR